MQRKLVDGYPPTFHDSLSGPSSRLKPSKKEARNRQKHYYTRDNVHSHWFPGKVVDPIRLLEHEVAIRTWSEALKEAQKWQMTD
jgi:hypothetical protein